MRGDSRTISPGLGSYLAPHSVGSAANAANHRFRVAVDEDRLRELAASHVVVIIDRLRLDIAVMAIRVAPIGALTIFERGVLRFSRASPVLIVHGLADAIPDKPANERSAHHAGKMASRAPAKGAPDQRTRRGAGERPRLFLRRASGGKQR